MAVLAYLLAVVIDPSPTAPVEEAVSPHIYLHPQADRCDSRAPADEVVVCGSNDAVERYRLHPVEERRFRDDPVRAEMNLGSGKLALHNEDKVLGGDQHSKRAMITFSLPF